MLGTNLTNMCIVGMCWYIRVLSPWISGLESQRNAWKSNLKSVRSPHVPNNQKHRDFTMCQTSEDSLGLSDPLLSSLICNSLAYPACYPTRGSQQLQGKKLLLQRTTMMKHRGTRFDPTYFNIKLVVHAIICASAELQPKCLANMIPIPQRMGKH